MSTQTNVLVTGSAGFIGFHATLKLLREGYSVIGVDNLNEYYDKSLKISRLNILKEFSAFRFFEFDLVNQQELQGIFANHRVEFVIHLAAQAGVRYSLTNPHAYMHSNYHGFLNVLEACRHFSVRHLIYASSSSVYGANRKMPFSVHDNVDHPLSLYAASKKANELMAHVYSSLYGLPTTGLRFFTVYGPFGRPDMALFIFTKSILEGRPIEVYNHGLMKRDFTYIDDIVESLFRLLGKIPSPNREWQGELPDPGTSFAPYRLYNIGSNNPTELVRFIDIIEQKLGRKAIRRLMPLQDGDVPETYADVEDLFRAVEFKPATPIEVGIERFLEWYRRYYNV